MLSGRVEQFGFAHKMAKPLRKAGLRNESVSTYCYAASYLVSFGRSVLKVTENGEAAADVKANDANRFWLLATELA